MFKLNHDEHLYEQITFLRKAMPSQGAADPHSLVHLVDSESLIIRELSRETAEVTTKKYSPSTKEILA